MQNLLKGSAQLPADIDGRICFRLAELGLSRWTIPIRNWQGRFRGMEKWLTSTDRLPTLTILGLLGGYDQAWVPLGDEAVAADLSRLDFTYWHARWPRWVTQDQPMRWQPLKSTFSDFEQHFSGGSVPQVWVSDRPVVAPAEASAYLLGMLPNAAPDEIQNLRSPGA